MQYISPVLLMFYVDNEEFNQLKNKIYHSCFRKNIILISKKYLCVIFDINFSLQKTLSFYVYILPLTQK